MFNLLPNNYKNTTIVQIFKFCAVGLLNTGVDWSSYYLLLYITNNRFLIINKIISYSFGLLNSFVFNKFWTFENYSRFPAQFTKFVPVNIAGLLLNAAIMYLSLKILGMDVLSGLVLATLGAMGFNFFFSKKFVFKD